MYTDDLFPAYRPPDWYPLQRALASVFGGDAVDATSAFWFVGFVAGPVDVGELRVYEHSGTRRTLALDREGRAYRPHEGIDAFVRVDEEAALVQALV
jgi:hypothetical protein